MQSIKSLDESKIIAALLHDVSNAHGLVFNNRALRLTLKKLNARLACEGNGFLTKTLPRLAKAFDKALAGGTPMNATELGFESLPGSKLPRFLGELFSEVLSKDGVLLHSPCVASVKSLRSVLYSFYKYKLPYSDEQEQQVLDRFKETEKDLSSRSAAFEELEAAVERNYQSRRSLSFENTPIAVITRRARALLQELFSTFDPLDIHPRHGPGAVATRQKLQEKYLWTNVSGKITEHYPFDAYFCASMGHVCDEFETFSKVSSEDLPARVILVPKDSRGPRLISCEPVDYQWVQQGLGRAIVKLVESHPLTKESVFFTDQSHNRALALEGSKYGRYSTLDLNEASDRVSADLVRLLFPKNVYTYLEACRSSSTVLPDGQVLPLKKFAPMGSCLCFPILALTVWAILAASATDANARECIQVYGDDVIVTTAFAGDAIEHLESFGLKVNRDKSCTGGLFRESCGMDAFNGVDVTPVRFRTVLSSLPCPDVYTSWIAYANSFYDRQYFRTYDCIVGWLFHTYGPIASDDMNLSCPSLREVPDEWKPNRRRFNKCLQRHEYRVYDVRSPLVTRPMKGWSMLLRYFSEAGTDCPLSWAKDSVRGENMGIDPLPAFSVSQYTSRKTSMLVKRWR